MTVIKAFPFIKDGLTAPLIAGGPYRFTGDNITFTVYDQRVNYLRPSVMVDTLVCDCHRFATVGKSRTCTHVRKVVAFRNDLNLRGQESNTSVFVSVPMGNYKMGDNLAAAWNLPVMCTTVDLHDTSVRMVKVSFPTRDFNLFEDSRQEGTVLPECEELVDLGYLPSPCARLDMRQLLIEWTAGLWDQRHSLDLKCRNPYHAGSTSALGFPYESAEHDSDVQMTAVLCRDLIHLFCTGQCAVCADSVSNPSETKETTMPTKAPKNTEKPPEPETDAAGIPIDPPDPKLLAKRAAQSNRNIKYVCTECGRDVGKENLKVVRVQFREMGARGRVDTSRVIGWLCMTPPTKGGKSCLDKNEYWTSKPMVDSPGMAGTRLANSEREAADAAS